MANRRRMEWMRIGLSVTVNSSVAMANLEAGYLTEVGLLQTAYTIRRILIDLQWQHGVSTASKVGIGITKVSQAAFDLGVTAVPNPAVEFQRDWMFHWHQNVLIAVEETAAGVFSSSTVYRQYDIRTGRKIGIRDVPVVVIGEANGQPTAVQMYVAMLCAME